MTEPAVGAGLGTAAIMGKSTRENFPVASRLLPGRIRRHLLAVYGFARLVDDIGDEVPGDRMARLDWVERELDLVYGGRSPTHPLMRRLAASVQSLDLSDEPFRRLIEANRLDQRVSSYATYEDLLAYCELSANPVGHLVLDVMHAATPERIKLSDAVCTGLQLTEHWQDVKEDHSRGRVYLPQEDLARFGCPVGDLGAVRPTEAFRRLMAFEVQRAGRLLDEGVLLAADLPGRSGLAIAAFVAGGRSALRAIAGARFDVVGGSPRPSKVARVRELLRTLAEVNLGPGGPSARRLRSSPIGRVGRGGKDVGTA